MILARTALSLALAAFWLCPSSALVPSSQLFRWQASTPAGGRNMECKPVRRPRHMTCTTERVECPTGNSARLGSRNYRNPAADGNVDLRPTKGVTKHGLTVRPSPFPRQKQRIRPGLRISTGHPAEGAAANEMLGSQCSIDRSTVGERRSVRVSSAAADKLSAAERVGIAFVNALFGIPLVRSTLASAARLVIADNARRFGVDWRASRSKWRSRLSDLKKEFRLLDAKPEYPTYYRRPFHAYDRGNLDWNAAFEVEAATMALTLRYWPHEVKAGRLNADDAQLRVRANITEEVKRYWHQGSAGRFWKGPQHICDLGCGIGISTEFLARAHHASATKLLGIDLSPHYLAVATRRASELDATKPWSRLMRSANFLHCAAEETHRRVGAKSLDLIYANFLFHELPTDASKKVLASIAAALRSGGVLAIADVDVERMVKRSSPMLVALFQITEPFFKEYAELDLEDALHEAGLKDVRVVLTDPKNRLVLARK